MWNQLPELILTQIFSYLDRNDKANAGQVCQSWNRALSSPVLWRSVTILLDKDLLGQSIADEQAEKYGQHMWKLELAWSRPYISSQKIRVIRNVQAEAGAEFLAILQTKQVQLKELLLTDWVFSCKWGNRAKLLRALASFLGCQRHMKILSLLNANLGVSDVLRLLSSVTRNSSNNLQSLDLRGAFKEWQAPHSNLRYLRFLGRFNCLTVLKLDYPALSNSTLDSIASATCKALKSLHVSVRDSDSRQHTLNDSAWQNLVTACPALTVSYTIVNISHYEDMSYLLLPSVPLAKFRMFSGYVWDQSRSRNFRSTVGLLISQYTKTLTEVMLQLRNNRESLDDLLVAMLNQCKRLTRVQFDGIIRRIESIKDICELQANFKTCFRMIHVKPRNINVCNRAILDEINFQYDHKLLKQGVDLCIEESSSVLLFY